MAGFRAASLYRHPRLLHAPRAACRTRAARPTRASRPTRATGIARHWPEPISGPQPEARAEAAAEWRVRRVEGPWRERERLFLPVVFLATGARSLAGCALSTNAKQLSQALLRRGGSEGRILPFRITTIWCFRMRSLRFSAKYIYIYIYIYICLFIYLFIHLFIYLSIYLFVCFVLTIQRPSDVRFLSKPDTGKFLCSGFVRSGLCAPRHRAARGEGP